MLAFSPGQAVIALPTTLETSVTCGDRLTYIRLVNESSSTETVYYCSSGESPTVVGSIRMLAGEVMIFWKRRQFHKLYASSASVYATGGMARPVALGPNK
jgi:hypothetical protein